VDGLPTILCIVKAKKIRNQILIASLYKGNVMNMKVTTCVKEEHKARVERVRFEKALRLNLFRILFGYSAGHL